MGTMRHVDPDLAELCRAVDPAVLGRRIRIARIAARLTQAQVAGDDISTTYVSRIEDGQRRPDIDLLTLLAGRMDITVEELLLGMTAEEFGEVHHVIEEAARDLAAGDGAEALAKAETAVARLAEVQVWDLRRPALQVYAGALVAVDQHVAAISVLEALAAHPAPDAAWLETLIALSRCLRRAGDLDRAIAVGEDASPTIEALGIAGTTEALQLTVTVAGAYVARGDSSHALRLCKRAIVLAEEFGLPLAKASAHWKASLVEDLRGEPEAALLSAREALALLEQSDDPQQLARVRSLVAYLLLKLDPPDATGALDVLDRAGHDVASDQVLRARAHFLLGDHGRALESMDRGEEIAPPDEPVIRAAAASLRGRIAAAEKRLDDAKAHYRAVARTLTTAGADRDTAQIWFELGTLFTEIGDSDDAADAFRRAAAANGVRTTGARPMVPPQRGQTDT